MTTVTNGNTVTLHYKGTLSDGTTFDSSHERNEPMTVTTGQGNLIPGFENALVGMAAGESKTFTIESVNAYGDTNPEAFATLERAAFPEDFPFETGMTIPLQGPHGQVSAILTEVTDTEVTCDLNHPLAGQDLTFEVEVITVEDAD
jgi:FKBP-type peptidyl-prolyl cis-trans isomerase 2